MHAYSIDLRQRIVLAVERGPPRWVVAEQFQVSLRTVERYLHLAHHRGDLTRRHASGRQRRFLAVDDPQLLQQLQYDPATLCIHQHRLLPGNWPAHQRADPLTCGCSTGVDTTRRTVAARERDPIHRPRSTDLH